MPARSSCFEVLMDQDMNGERDSDALNPASIHRLSDVLLALGQEFGALGAFTEQFQTVLSPALRQVANLPECHRDVQSLDLLSQRLAALSRYLLTIQASVPGDVEIDAQHALSNISLSDLAYRLRGAPVPPQPERRAGELELF
jgi:hypothetical protein